MGKYALILVSALVFSLATYSHALLNSYRASNTRIIESYEHNQAYNVAQSALMVAMSELLNNSSSSFLPEADSIITYPFGGVQENWPEMNGAYHLQFHNQGDTLLSVQATGFHNESTYVTRAGLVFTSGGSFDWPLLDQAVHAEGTINLGGSSRIIGNASLNSIAAGAVTTGWSSYIDGNLSVGPGGDPDLVAPKVSQWAPDPVWGQRGVLPHELEFNMPEFPPMPSSTPTGQSFRVTSWHEEQMGTHFNVSHANGILLDELAIAQNRSMTLNIGSGDYVLHVKNINIPQGHLNIVGDGTLTIYVEDSFTLGGGSTFNASGQPENLMIYYKGAPGINFGGNITMNSNMFIKDSNLSIGGSNTIRGNIITGGSNVSITGNAGSFSRVLYAPNAHVSLEGSGRLYGSIVSNSFSATGDTFVDFGSGLDVDLPEIDSGGGGGSGGSYSITYWN